MGIQFFIGTAPLPFKYGSEDVAYKEDEIRFFLNAFKPGDRISKVVTKARQSFRGRPYVALHVLMDHYKAFWGGQYITPEEIGGLLEAHSYQLQLQDTPIYLATGNPEEATLDLRKSIPDV